MAYSADQLPSGLDVLTSLADADIVVAGDATDSGRVKGITKANLVTDLADETQTLTNKTIDANGTGNSISNIDVADLADGTDGELITWDSAGSAAVVAVGTSAQVLTSNGAGAAPTFQAAAGGAPEGTAVLSTGETGGTKFLREDGDNTCSWVAVPGGGDALTSNPLSQFAATTSLQLKNTISDETGSGAAVFATSPTLVTPILGTPTSGVATNLTGTAASLTAGLATDTVTKTGTGSTYATNTSPTLVTPTIGVATATSVNKVAVTAPATSSTLTIVDGATLTASASATVSGTNTGDEAAASVTVAGVAELATTAEIDTGTDSTRTIPVDQFVASKRNIRWLAFNLVEAATDCAAATNIAGDFVSPVAGTILQSDTTPFYLYATNSTAGTTGTMVVDISIGGTSIMTINKLDFDTTEKTTTTAATPPDLTTTTVAVGDIITIDIDSIHTTAAKGLTVYMAIRE